MNCREIEILLNEDLDNEALPEVEAHLKECCRCREIHKDLSSLKALNGLLIDQVKAPSSFSSAVLAEMARQRRWGIHGTRWSLAAALVVGLVAIWMVGFSGDSTPRTVFPAAGEVAPAEWTQPELVLDAVPFSENVLFQPESEGDYIEVLLEESDHPAFLLRLPPEIEIHSTALHHDFYLNHVSH